MLAKICIHSKDLNETYVKKFSYMVSAKTWLLLNGFLPYNEIWQNICTNEIATLYKINEGEVNDYSN